MSDLNEYVTETEAAQLVGVTAGKGNVWRHLREHAPHIKLEEIFGYTAVRRDTLQAYCNGKRQGVVHVSVQNHLRALQRMLEERR